MRGVQIQFLLRLLLINIIWSFGESKGIDIQNPVVEVNPNHIFGRANKDLLFCERVEVSGRSRWELKYLHYSRRILLSPSGAIPEKLHRRIQVCLHGNFSLDLCQCDLDQWKGFNKGIWNSVISPYQEKYLDVKFIGELPGVATVSIEEDAQPWRLMSLSLGILLILLAPVVSNWVSFYYGASMIVGVFLVILILLFQGMKLLPYGKKSLLTISIYGPLVGAGTYLLHYLSSVVNSILVNFGLGEEMHNPVFVFVSVAIAVTGAALGYWMVRKFVITKDGRVDYGIAQFVKWAISIIGGSFIYVGTCDLALMAAFCTICCVIEKSMRKKCRSLFNNSSFHSQCRGPSPEFLNRPQQLTLNASDAKKKYTTSWANSPVKGLVSPSFCSWTDDQHDHYSTFHKIRKRKKMTKQEWENFTQESTQEALAEWAASPGVSRWLMENADRIHLLQPDCSSEDSCGSESNSTDHDCASTERCSLFRWWGR